MAAYEASMRLWPVEYESIDVQSRFGSTHVVACGPRDAAPLVCMHAFFVSLTAWAYNVGDLSHDRRVYALDVMGQPGKSIPDQPLRSRAEMAEWLTSTLDSLGISQAVDLMGWSYGGFAALNYAIQNPDRVRRLVLLAPAGGLRPLRVQFYIRGMLTRLPGRFWSDSMMRWFFYAPNLRNNNTKRFFDTISNQFYFGVRHFRLQPTVLPSPYTDQELRSVRSPTLLLIGQQEALYNPPPALARARQLIPNIDAELVPDAGHELPASKPEIINNKVRAFI